MNRRISHTKIKNTGILFELLTRQITVDVMNGNSNSSSVDMMKTFFNENTELGKELQLYQILLRENYTSESKADRLLDAVIMSRQKLKNSSLKREKYNFIKEIKNNFNIDEFFSARIPNYRTMASIYKTFLTECSSEEYDPTEIVNNRYVILEHITQTKRDKKTPIESASLLEYKRQDKDLRILTYTLLIEKFNTKYGNLNENQKTLLKEYINNMANTSGLKDFVDSEIVKIKKELKSYISKIGNKVTKIKLREAIVQSDSISKGKIVQDKQVISLMRYYALIEELKNVCNK